MTEYIWNLVILQGVWPFFFLSSSHGRLFIWSLVLLLCQAKISSNLVSRGSAATLFCWDYHQRKCFPVLTSTFLCFKPGLKQKHSTKVLLQPCGRLFRHFLSWNGPAKQGVRRGVDFENLLQQKKATCLTLSIMHCKIVTGEIMYLLVRQFLSQSVFQKNSSFWRTSSHQQVDCLGNSVSPSSTRTDVPQGWRQCGVARNSYCLSHRCHRQFVQFLWKSAPNRPHKCFYY